MRRYLLVLPVIAAVCLQLIAPAPSNAATFRFDDEKGDATGIEEVTPTPRPNDAELDIHWVTFRSTADTLYIVAKFEKLGTPPYATGATRTVGFTYDEAEYNFRYQSPAPPQDNLSATGLFFRDGLGTTIPCGRCSGKLDLKAGTVNITAPYASMSAGIRSSKATSPALKPGAKFTNLNAAGLRTLSLAAVTADQAAAKAEVEFVL